MMEISPVLLPCVTVSCRRTCDKYYSGGTSARAKPKGSDCLIEKLAVTAF